MLSLKVVRYQLPEDIHQGFDLYPIYPGQHLHVDADWVRIEGGPDGVISIATDPGTNFFIMNGDGDTIERFPWDWLKGSPERTKRVRDAAARLGSPEAVVIVRAENRAVYIGRHVRESGAIATTLNLEEGPGPALLDNRAAAQVAAALLAVPYAADAEPVPAK